MSKSRILVVEDDETLRTLLVQKLRVAGFEAEEAEDGQKAMEILESGPDRFVLVLSDYEMPRLDGVSLRKAVHGRLEIPFILMTGVTEVMTADMAREAGFAGYLPKPFCREELRELISALVGQAEAA